MSVYILFIRSLTWWGHGHTTFKLASIKALRSLKTKIIASLASNVRESCAVEAPEGQFYRAALKVDALKSHKIHPVFFFFFTENINPTLTDFKKNCWVYSSVYSLKITWRNEHFLDFFFNNWRSPLFHSWSNLILKRVIFLFLIAARFKFRGHQQKKLRLLYVKASSLYLATFIFAFWIYALNFKIFKTILTFSGSFYYDFIHEHQYKNVKYGNNVKNAQSSDAK